MEILRLEEELGKESQTRVSDLGEEGNMGARLDKKGRGQKQGKGLGLCQQAERKSVGKEI